MVATTTQVGDLVREVGGGAVEVDQILQPNTDPHDYEPRPDDVVNAADAELVFASGDDLDSWVDEVVSDSGSDATLIELGAKVPERLPGEQSGEEASRFDPHWWHDPRNAEAAVRAIEAALSATGARRARRASPATPMRTWRGLRALDAGDRRLRRLGASLATQAGHRPRRLRLLRRSLRDRRDRRGDPLADHPGPALGEGPQRAGADDRSGRGRGGLPRELAELEGRRRDRRGRPAPAPS